MDYYCNELLDEFKRLLRRARQQGIKVPDADGIDWTLTMIKEAEKFYLPCDFPKQYGFSTDMVEGARLPYPLTVLEYEATVNPDLIKADQSAASKRIVLLREEETEDDEEPEGFFINTAYWLDDMRMWELYPSGVWMPYDPEVTPIPEDEGKGWDVMGTSMHRYLPELYALQEEEWRRQGLSDDQIAWSVKNDLSDEIRAALVFLAFLSCRNVHGVDLEPTARHRKKARKRAKLPPYKYHVLNVFLEQPEVSAREHQGGTHQSPRLHRVMGHFKVRKTGRFWWGSYIRGRANKGVVDKDYRVKIKK